MAFGVPMLAFSAVTLAFAGKFISGKYTSQKNIIHVLWSSIVVFVFSMTMIIVDAFLDVWILAGGHISNLICFLVIIVLAIVFGVCFKN